MLRLTIYSKRLYAAVLAAAFLFCTVARDPAAAQEANAKAGTRPTQPPPVLQQLNSALEELSGRISPAVVQILVTGYGPLEEKDRSDTALIVRQHALGSGVIVDSNGYIMTNAHVVEGAQRIHVALPMPSLDVQGEVGPLGKQRILDARLIGIHKEHPLGLGGAQRGLALAGIVVEGALHHPRAGGPCKLRRAVGAKRIEDDQLLRPDQ